jgi:hypothetical protein
MQGAAEAIAAALAAMPEYPNGNRESLQEHVTWLWNTYSGAAHTHAWPRLLPGSGQDRRFPGDFPGDFLMIATTAQLGFSQMLQDQPGMDPVELAGGLSLVR